MGLDDYGMLSKVRGVDNGLVFIEDAKDLSSSFGELDAED